MVVVLGDIDLALRRKASTQEGKKAACSKDRPCAKQVFQTPIFRDAMTHAES